MVKATFYAMLLNDAVELGAVSGFITEDLKSSLVGQNFRLQEPHGEGRVAGCSLGKCIPLEATFYAMVVDDAAELGLSHRLTMDCMIWAMQKLNWGRLESWLVDIDHRLRRAQASRRATLLTAAMPPSNPMRRRVGVVPEELASPHVEGLHPQFPSLPTFIDGRAVAGVPRKNQWAEVASTGTSSSLRGTSSSSSDRSSRHSSLEVASTSSSSHEGPSTPGKSVLKRRGRSFVGPVPEIVAEGPEFPGAPARLNPQDGPSSHFLDPKVVPTLKRTSLEKQYLLPVGYTFVIPEADATVNEPPTKCIAVYRTTLNYNLRFPLHLVIEETLNKYELAPAQVMPTSWHNIRSFIATCERRGLTCSAQAFSLLHTVQRAPKETGDLGWYCSNNRP
ncbi:hypothetical protein Cgig2_013929 [Carnegiea gigantea]|uniref:Uncharacterized protein n=1 Tax=Carnegiea gigantea TaxID=171969 RepID=A0A9Q1K1I0_9CARY|nr:hypothetical protein Cgig2_013929 [Carnegiea gigantea]